mmetsp:Transcript_12012/g.15665  ORF Transcript_12012/g.15665 Transcript_12012/m.15665 type:complete len:80 (+) Transcript_12012:77-316(+)
MHIICIIECIDIHVHQPSTISNECEQETNEWSSFIRKVDDWQAPIHDNRLLDGNDPTQMFLVCPYIKLPPVVSAAFVRE